MGAIAFAAVATGTLAFWTHQLLISKHTNFLHRLCKGLEPGNFQTQIHPGKHIWRKRTYTFEGTYHRRPLIIRYTFQPKLWSSGERNPASQHVNDLEIHLPLIQKFWLRLLTDYQEIPGPEEIQVGIEALDDHFLIHSNQPEAAKSFLQDDSVWKLLQIFQFMFNKLEIHRGTLKLVYTPPVLEQLTHFDLEIILDTLMRLLSYYETQKGNFKIVTVSATGVCPYCRETFDPSIEQLVECNSCSTDVHETCWQQNGQCTTWGCNSAFAHPVDPRT